MKAHHDRALIPNYGPIPEDQIAFVGGQLIAAVHNLIHDRDPNLKEPVKKTVDWLLDNYMRENESRKVWRQIFTAIVIRRHEIVEQLERKRQPKPLIDVLDLT